MGIAGLHEARQLSYDRFPAEQTARIGEAMRNYLPSRLLHVALTLAALMSAIASRDGLAQANSELLVQAQAADVLSDLITYTVARADARAQNIQEYLHNTGREDAYDKARPIARIQLPFYTEVFQGAVLFIKGGGDQYADPSLKTLDNSQLSTEMSQLQVYNIQTFMKLVEKVKQVASMKEFLKSVGDLEKYQEWAKS